MSLPQPHTESTHFERGLAAFRSNKFALAENELRSALATDPGDIEATHVLGLTLRSVGRRQEALTCLQQVVERNTDDAECWSNLGALLRELGHIPEAVAALRKAVELEPRNSVALNNLGTALIDSGDLVGSRAMFEAALSIKPTYADAQINLARSSYEIGRIDEAKKLASSAIALDPRHAEAQNRLSFVHAASGEVEAALKATATAHDLDPWNDQITSNMFLRALSCTSVSSEDILVQAKAWGSRYNDVPPMAKSKSGSLKRVGFISGDLRFHPVGFFISPVLEVLAQSVEVFCYSTNLQRDFVTERVIRASSEFRTYYRTPAEQTAIEISNDGLDVLVDLSGHTGDNRLDVLSHKPAPVQATWLGFSGTTGLPQMDSIIADWNLVPAGSEWMYTESVSRLQNCFLCVEPVGLTPGCPRNLGGVVFGVFNNPSKFSTTCYKLWARILRECPNSVILFKYHHSHDPYVQRRITARLCEHGANATQVKFAPYMSRQEHCDLLASVNVALDTYPYSGATTTIDALACGTPVVTLAGDRYASRMSASMVNTVGLPDLVCDLEDEYVDTALALAQSGRPLDLRERVLSSPLCDPRAFASALLDSLQAVVA